MDKVYNGIVIFGEMGAGKDALAEQFKSLRAKSKIYNMGVLCREMMKVARVNPAWRGQERYIGQTTADKLREMDLNIMCDYILALIYEQGENLTGFDCNIPEGDNFNQQLIKGLGLIRNHELSIIVGGRTLSDLDYWRSKEFLIVGVKVSEAVRKSRLVSRDGKQIANNSSSTHNTEADAANIVNKLSDEIIINDGTLEELRESAENLLLKYNF